MKARDSFVVQYREKHVKQKKKQDDEKLIFNDSS